MTLKIEPIPAFTDNYIWCLHDGGRAWVVDPGDATPVIAFLERSSLRLEGILITHHHPDHTGGIEELRQRYAPTAIYGPNNPVIAGLTRTVSEGDHIQALGIPFEIWATPGHTLDHIAFIAQEHTPPLLFCGDTLFAAGCGRLFEGTASQLYFSLRRFAQLPETTVVFCTHEYTQANLRFAITVEPANLQLQHRVQLVAQQRAHQQPTLPSTLTLELATNPFLRVQQPAVRASAEQHGGPCNTDIEVFAALRRWKDRF